jgi:hypothetical protein
MSKHGTALTEGQLAEFLGAGVKALTLIANYLGPELTHNWSNNGQAMQRAFLSVLASQEMQEQKENQFLKLISGDKELVLDECNGAEILADAKEVFAYIDSDLKNWGADEKGKTTGKTPVQVFEIKKDAIFAQMFGSLSSDLKKLCLTQNQIIGFVRQYRKWLRADGYATIFLFESNNEFFVARVNVYSDGKLHVFVNRFEYSHVWHAEYRHRLVVPQLATTQ